jgi:hypothetical protein
LLGALSMRSHARGKTDEILRRTNWRARNGFAEANIDIEALTARSISAAEYRRAVQAPDSATPAGAGDPSLALTEGAALVGCPSMGALDPVVDDGAQLALFG